MLQKNKRQINLRLNGDSHQKALKTVNLDIIMQDKTIWNTKQGRDLVMPMQEH